MAAAAEGRLQDIECPGTQSSQDPLSDALCTIPLLPLVETVEVLRDEPLLSDCDFEVALGEALRRGAALTRQRCALDASEVGAIHLYTQETPLYSVLNLRLRDALDTPLNPCLLPYLKLLLTALYKLPQHQVHVYRGVKLDIHLTYLVGEKITWWALSSTTTTMGLLQSERFVGQRGARTMLSIDALSAIDIRPFSAMPNEDEYLLPPGCQFRVHSILQPGNKMFIIQLTQLPYTPIVTQEVLPTPPRRMTIGATPAPAHAYRNYVPPRVYKDFKEPRLVLATQGKGPDQLQGAGGMCQRAAGGIVVCDWQRKELIEFSLHGEPARRLACFPDKVRPNAVACYGDDFVLVDGYHHNVLRCGPDGTLRWKVGTKGDGHEQVSHPYDITVLESGHIAVTDQANFRVQILSGDGTFLRSLNPDTKVGNLLGIAVNTEGDILISDTLQHRILRLRSDGTVAQVFGSRGSLAGQLKCPHGLALDFHKNLLVADRDNSRIVVFTPAGEATHFSTPGKPSRVFVDRDGNVVVNLYETNTLVVY